MIKVIALLTPIYVPLLWSLVFLIRPTTRNKAKTTLGTFMLMATLLYTSHAIYFSQQYLIYSFFESIYIFSSLLLYPLFYKYIIEISSPKSKTKHLYIQYLPALVLSCMSLILTFILSVDERIFYVQSVLIENNLKHLKLNSLVGIKAILFLLSRIIFILQSFVYLTLGIKLANAHNQRVSNYFSDIYERKINWIKEISIVILLLSTAGIVFTIIGRSFFARHELLLLIPSVLFATIFFEIGFKANKQLQSSEDLVVENGITDIEDDRIDTLSIKLIELFKSEKIYQLSDLRITTISQKLDTNRTYISKLINDEFGMNFNEFVNKYRIEEAKHLLKSKEHHQYTMEYIAEKSGFGSVASFSRCFKEFEGITPGKFRNS